MSEYQYYEFQAIDRPLTQVEMAELRALSTRASITPMRLQNVYHFGDFKGDPLALMERFFDAFVYVANWGTNRCMLRLPARFVDPSIARKYEVEGTFEVFPRHDAVILEFTSEDEEGTGWVEDEDAANWMPALLPVRADLANGDHRALYLAWLAGAGAGMLDDEQAKPPVPAGLGSLSASLKAFAQFLRIDADLLAVAASGSDDLPAAPSSGEVERWIKGLPTRDKDALLTRLAGGSQAHVQTELRRRFRDATAPHAVAKPVGRQVGELIVAAETRAATQRREEAAREAAERTRRQREQAAVRASYLNTLIGREDELWLRIDSLIETKRPTEYDHAVRLIQDLRDLAVRERQSDRFAARLGSLRDRYAKRPGLLGRLDQAGLTV